MEKMTCPRCESGILDESGICNSCGYEYKVICPKCTHKNSPSAKYCGKCGEPMTLTIKLHKSIGEKISHETMLKIRNFIAGIGFGTVLAVFAIGAFR